MLRTGCDETELSALQEMKPALWHLGFGERYYDTQRSHPPPAGPDFSLLRPIPRAHLRHELGQRLDHLIVHHPLLSR